MTAWEVFCLGFVARIGWDVGDVVVDLLKRLFGPSWRAYLEYRKVSKQLKALRRPQ